MSTDEPQSVFRTRPGESRGIMRSRVSLTKARVAVNYSRLGVSQEFPGQSGEGSARKFSLSSRPSREARRILSVPAGGKEITVITSCVRASFVLVRLSLDDSVHVRRHIN